MDGLTAQAPKPRQTGLKGAGNPLDGAAKRRGFDVPAELREFGQTPHIPRQSPGQGWMKKPLQRAVDAGQCGTEVLQQRPARRRGGQNPPRQITHEAGGVVDSVAGESADRLTLKGGEKPRHRQSGVLLRQVVEHPHQAVRTLGVGCDIEYLQHELAWSSARRVDGRGRMSSAQMKVAVPLPRQSADRGGQTVEVARNSFGFRRTQRRRRGPQS